MSQTWPTLSTEAQREDFNQFPITDPTVRFISMDGRVSTRPGVKPILYGWSFVLRHLTTADKEALEALQTATRIGGETITWSDLRPSTDSTGTVGVHTVRLANPMILDLDDEGFGFRTEVLFYQEPGT